MRGVFNSGNIPSQGFALLEVVIGLALFGLALISIPLLFIRGYGTVTSAGERTKALFIARENIEHLINNHEQIDNPSDLTIEFDGAEEPIVISVPGKHVTVTQDYSLVRRYNTTQGEIGQDDHEAEKGEISLQTFVYYDSSQ